MPTQLVIEKLEDLQKELNKASHAIRHIEDAANVSHKASEIVGSFKDSISDIKRVEEEYRNKLLSIHSEKIDNISNILNQQESSLNEKTKLLKGLSTDISELLNQIRGVIKEINNVNFPDRLDKIDNQISSINIGIGNLQSLVQTVNSKQEALDKSLNKFYAELTNRFRDDCKVIRSQIKTNRIIAITIGVMVFIEILILYIK